MYKAGYRDPRALEPPSQAPPPYTLFVLPAIVDPKKAAADEGAAYTYIMYIPGISEDTGEPTCVLQKNTRQGRVW